MRDGDYQGEDCDSPLDGKQKHMIFAPHYNQEAIPTISAGIAD